MTGLCTHQVFLYLFPGIAVHHRACIVFVCALVVSCDLELYGLARFSPQANLQAVFHCFVAPSSTIEANRIVCGDTSSEILH